MLSDNELRITDADGRRYEWIAGRLDRLRQGQLDEEIVPVPPALQPIDWCLRELQADS